MSRLIPRPLRAAWLLAVVLPLTLTAPVLAQKDVPGKDSLKFLAAFRDVVRKASESTVRIRCDDKDVALGTVVSKDGFILTKATELKDKPVCKFFDGRSLDAKVVGVHEVWDLALLKVEARNLVPAEWRDSKMDPVGSWVASAGTDIDPVAVGVLSVGARNIPPSQVFRPGGSSGGFLGVSLEQIEGGVRIADVQAKSAAEKAGIKIDDIVIEVAGKKIEDVEGMIDIVKGYKPGDEITVKVRRDKKELELKAKLDKRPPDNSARADFQNNLGSKLSARKSGFPTILQHDTVLKTTDCGGPLVDLDGKVIGLNIARAGRVETWAIPAEVIQTLIPDLMSGKLLPTSVPAGEDKLEAARDAVKKAQEEVTLAAARAADARSTLDKVEQEKAAAEKRLLEAKATLKKLEDEAKAVKPK